MSAALAHAPVEMRAPSARIMIVTDAWEPQVNGVVRTLKQTRRELEAMGHVVEMLTPQAFRTIPCPTYPEIRLSIGASRAVARAIDRFAPDALHIATEGPLGWAARRHSLRIKRRFTTSYHTRFPEYVNARFAVPTAWTYAILRRFHAPAAAVLCPTPSIRADLTARGFDNVVVWSRGVDIDIFRPGPRDLIASARPVFLYVGRLAVEKNVEAFLALDLPGSKWVVGEGPQREELQRKYPHAHYAGIQTQADLARYYSAADVFVFPSRTDTFGLVMLEALACGLPVAAYPVPGPRDIFTDTPEGRTAGAIDEDLGRACRAALGLSRAAARAHALRFSWAAASRQFAGYLLAGRQ
jgi:glycosyltransferase involved in cell wall biosynthesis